MESALASSPIQRDPTAVVQPSFQSRLSCHVNQGAEGRGPVAGSCRITRCPGARATPPAALSTHSALRQSRRRRRDPRRMPRTVALNGRHGRSERRDPAPNATALLAAVRHRARTGAARESESVRVPQIAQQQRRSPAWPVLGADSGNPPTCPPTPVKLLAPRSGVDSAMDRTRIAAVKEG